MKKICIVFLLGFFCFFSKQSAKAESDEISYNLQIEEEILINVEASWELKAHLTSLIIFGENEKSLIYQNGQIIISIDGTYVSHQEDDSYLFLLVINQGEYELVKIGLNNLKVSKTTIDFKATKILLHDDTIWLVGEKEQDAYICKLTKELNSYLSYCYGGDGFEGFVDALVYQNRLYFLGVKDAQSHDSPFENVGSNGERKYFISEIDSKGVIKKTIYFNLGYGDDSLISFNNMFYLQIVLGNQDKVKGYLINENLNVIRQTNLIDDNLNRWYVYSDSKFLLGINRETIFVDNQYLDINLKGDVKKVIALEDGLLVYTDNTQQLRRYLINEYHINQLSEVVIERYADVDLEQDLNNTLFFDIVSYITRVTIEVDTIDPFFSKTISGTYEGVFRIMRSNQIDILVSNNIIVKPFDNISSGSVYPVGYVLFFFGYAKVNGLTVFNGHTFTSAGQYEIVISDVQGQSYTRKITVVENYYKEVNISEPFDMKIASGESPVIKLNIQSDELERVIITDEFGYEVENQISIIDDDVYLTLPKSIIYGVKKYFFQQAIYSNNTSELSGEIAVLTLKKVPIVYLKEKSSKLCQIESLFSDLDQTIVNIRIVFNDLAKCEINSYLNNMALVYQGDYQQVVKAQVVLEYDLGDGVILSKNLYEFAFKADKPLVEIAEIEYEYLSDVKRYLSSAILTINIEDKNMNLSELTLDGNNLAGKYATKDQTPIFYLCLLISVVILVLGVWYARYHKKRKGMQKLTFFVEKKE